MSARRRRPALSNAINFDVAGGDIQQQSSAVHAHGAWLQYSGTTFGDPASIW
jgi:hypothetical protein